MKNVEQIAFGFQWAEPLQGQDFNIEFVGSDLQITGLFPTYKAQESPCDLIHQVGKYPEQIAKGQKTRTQSPEVYFANADTDRKLIAFVRRFGPVVARECSILIDKKAGEPYLPLRLIAHQDMQELKNEQAIYRAALGLVMQLGQQDYDYMSGQQLMKTIAINIKDWPRQWERERSLRGFEPAWKLTAESLERIESLSVLPPDRFPDKFSGRIVTCELLNAFRLIVFPNPLEMHSSIKFGIRPLLYSILRRQFVYPRSFAICANTECRNFFNIERSGQNFCSPECSLHHRQRIYWQEQGKKLRKKRAAKRRKPRKMSTS
jgi:hypothetical protein